MYMAGAFLVGLAFGANGGDTRTVFVENGVPKNIREMGFEDCATAVCSCLVL